MENNYQFIIDEIPDIHLNEFIEYMSSFTKKTECRFFYNEGKGQRNALLPIDDFSKTNRETKQGD